MTSTFAPSSFSPHLPLHDLRVTPTKWGSSPCLITPPVSPNTLSPKACTRLVASKVGVPGSRSPSLYHLLAHLLPSADLSRALSKVSTPKAEDPSPKVHLPPFLQFVLISPPTLPKLSGLEMLLRCTPCFILTHSAVISPSSCYEHTFADLIFVRTGLRTQILACL